MEIIQTERLVLRDFEEADWEAVHSYGSDLEVVRYMDWGPNTEEETKNLFNEQSPIKRSNLAESTRLQ